jgi:pilus assembly protein CpaC
MKHPSLLTAMAALGAVAAPGLAVAAPQAAAPIQVQHGQATLFQAPAALERVAVSDPKVANVRVLSDRQVLIQGLLPGTTTMMVWLKGRAPVSHTVKVELDLAGMQAQLRDVTGNQKLRVAYSGRSVLLSGDAPTAAQRAMAEQVIGAYGHPVVNLVQVPQGNDQVAIDVHVLELSKSAALSMGLTYGGGEITDIANGVRKYIFKPWELMTGEQTPGRINTFSQLDFLAVKIEALQRRGEAKLLAHPTLVAMDGGTAKFLAGGEIPIPVQQALGQTTILWKEFGVRLEIKPIVQPSGRIQLAVAPEVSSLDFANGLKQATFTIPALKTRRAETQVMLAANETLVLGGLMNRESNRNWEMIPGLGDLPVIGELFKSRRFQESETELAILVTPRLVKSEVGQAPPGKLPALKREWER